MRAHPMVGDSLLAAALLSIDVLIFFFEDLPMPPWYLALPADVLVVLPLVVRRRHPLWSAYLVLAFSVLHSELRLGLGAVFCGAIAIYTAVVYAGRKPGALYVVVFVLANVAQAAIGQGTDWVPNTITSTLIFVLCWVLGEYVGARRAYHAELEARLHLLETERGQAARIAVAEERGRIARELHDVVAHAVSVIVVQADGASYMIRSNPELAERAVRTISDTGRGALAELRRLLDLLRGEGASGEPRVPQPDAATLAELAERVRAAGVPVRLDVEGELGDLPAGVSLGVYRIVQESLTNTLKHAGPGASATVRVRQDAEAVDVEVADDGGDRGALVAAGEGAEVPGGNGLIGMRERAHVFGGTLEVGPGPGGGWRVRASLPVRLSS
ncbi:sensor histidine kinase [Amycolatopsis cihanbeyliensis]|uniref:histidine kinase n=1 Tax=Amycolatopsis cihanbeyliensis TaxID=1128664 RepID=A0A542DKZ2_AMYCI|nr:signal transduction histidine kinase [Amycolatopsis cihanbeyliensis]